MSQTENVAWNSDSRVSDNSEKLLWRSMVFSPVLCLVRTISNKPGIRYFKVSKKKKNTNLHVHRVGITWLLRRESYQRRTSVGIQGRKEGI